MSNININKQADFNDFVFLKNFIAFKDIIFCNTKVLQKPEKKENKMRKSMI